MLQGKRTEQQSTGIDTSSRYSDTPVPSWVENSFTPRQRLINYAKQMTHKRTVERKAKDKYRNQLTGAKQRERRLVQAIEDLMIVAKETNDPIINTVTFYNLEELTKVSKSALEGKKK